MNNTEDILILIITIGGGLFAILASILNWNFFFEHRKAQFFVKTFGRKGARIFYTILGVCLLSLSYYM